MSSSVFSTTLQEITTTKLSELSKKRAVFEQQKASILSDAKLQPDQRQRIAVLVDGLKQCFSIKTQKEKRGDDLTCRGRIIIGRTNDANLEVTLKKIEHFLEQARYDPSISAKLLQDWESSLTHRLDVESLKYQYATLYGQLVTEWLSAEKTISITAPSSEAPEGWQEIDKSAREEFRAEWEELLFSKKQAKKALKDLRDRVETFETQLSSSGQFTTSVLHWVINGLIASGLLSDEKNSALKDFIASPIIMGEIADILNMRMSSFDTWSWETVVPIEQRRHVNGAFHMYIDEDLLQAIFLQYIGVKWAVFFKNAFALFLNHNGAWSSFHQVIPLADRRRREYFLGPQTTDSSLQDRRLRLWKSIFFMSQLPKHEIEMNAVPDGEEEVVIKSARRRAPAYQVTKHFYEQPEETEEGDYGQEQTKIQSMAADEGEIPRSSMAIKQLLLHLVSTEIHVGTKLHGDYTCVRSEFDSFFQSLPHSTVYAVLSFFGLSDRWLNFFRKFIEAPLIFVGEDSATGRIRKRGIPVAHALSSVCGEAVLFCLDYSVNQSTGGTLLWRMHDDFWMWSSSHEIVAKGWKAITDFNDIMGLTLNEAKTGTVRVRGDRDGLPPTDISLPAGEIRWGFLKLDPTSGRFLIDLKMVDKHIDELRSQLEAKKLSVFSWIQAWNTYTTTFFKNNFGKPANCFGREHVDMMLSTMIRIQTRIFSDSNVVDFLKSTLEARFGITDIPDGYLFFPTELGGLGLQNPFIDALQIRDEVLENPAMILDDFAEAEVEFYGEAKVAFEKEEGNRKDLKFVPEDADTFFSFEEFTRYREDFMAGGKFIRNLDSSFQLLLRKPTPEFLKGNESDEAMLARYTREVQNAPDRYMRWVALLYGPDMVEKFGGWKIVDQGLLPIGMFRYSVLTPSGQDGYIVPEGKQGLRVKVNCVLDVIEGDLEATTKLAEEK